MQAAISAFQKHVFSATTDTLQNNAGQFEILQVSQEVRSRLSTQAFVLVLVVACVYTWALWDTANQINLVLWSSAVVATAAHRAWYCRGLLQNLANSKPAALIRNESYLLANGIVYGILIGSAYWLIALHSDERTVFAVTIMSCMYAIGTTANSSLHFRTFAIFTLLNLGQGVAFFLYEGHKVDIPIMMTLIVSMILLLRFGHRNAELFRKSVSRRLENVAQNAQLIKNQQIIEASLKIANEANTSKSRFLAAASHDLRQPLHALSLFLGSLQNTETSPKQDELLEYIQRSTETLNNQFNSLLDLSQLDSGIVKTNVVMFDLQPLLQNLVDSLTLEAKEKKLTLSYVGEKIILQNDPVLLDRVIRNIMTNALKYTDVGSINITCESLTDRVIVSVADTGCGIAKQDHGFIFDEFAQIGNPERQISQGTGLGLAIVRRIAAMLGISVSVDSITGHGSTFKLDIPRQFSSASQSSPTNADTIPDEIGKQDSSTNETSKAIVAQQPNVAPSPLRLDGWRILVVDDDPNVLLAFRHILEARGAIVIACESYQSAIAVDKPTEINFAFLDDMLAVSGSGLDIANWLTGYIDKRRIVLVTGNNKPKRVSEIRSSGFSVHTKPLSPSALNAILMSGRKLQTMR